MEAIIIIVIVRAVLLHHHTTTAATAATGSACGTRCACPWHTRVTVSKRL